MLAWGALNNGFSSEFPLDSLYSNFIKTFVMKQVLTLLLALLACQLVLAQSVPQSFSYQAVARDAQGNCLAGETLTIRLTVLDEEGGDDLYSERQTVETNFVGHFQVNVGDGQGKTGTFDVKAWLGTPYLKVEIAEGASQTSGFEEVGQVPLQSVPYALAASSADSATSATFADSAAVAGMAWNGKLTSGTGSEFINFSGSTGNTKVAIGGSDNGLITVQDPNGNQRIRLVSEPTQQGVGTMFLNGTSSTNFLFSNFNANFPNNPDMALQDAGSITQVQLFIDASGMGVVAADIKNFFMDHPTQPGKEIWYASIEGPEAAAYERGTATLVNGEAEITFADHFQIVANPSTMTITTSPWSADAKGLAVVERTATGFKVKELFGGTGTYQFDWRVDAKRKGFENFEVIRDKRNDPFRDSE
jgi:hypothetical protein